MFMYDCLIIYEVFPRELESVLLLKCELERRGYTVEFERRPYENVYALRKKYNNKVRTVIVPTLYSEDAMYWIYFFAGRVKTIFNLQWEQVSTFLGESENTGGRSMYPQGFCREATTLCWGEKPKENLINSGMIESKCPIVGPIHMDFFRKEFCRYYLDKDDLFRKFGLDPKKKKYLFISSFSFVALPKNLQEYLYDIQGQDYVDQLTKFSLQSQVLILKWFDDLLCAHPEILLIYRPHPIEFENQDLQNMKARHKNFKVISEYSVKQWILTVDKVYLWFSTSSVELFFSKTPFTILRPIPVPSEDKELTIFKNAKMINSYSSFIEDLEIFENSPLNSEIITRYYNVDKFKPSYERICDVIETSIISNQYDVNWNYHLVRNFKIRILRDLLKARLKPAYIRVLKLLNEFNMKYNTAILGSRVQRYFDGKESDYKIFHKDAYTWEAEIPNIIMKLEKIVHKENLHKLCPKG